MIPAGIVATTRSQPSRSVDVAIDRRRARSDEGADDLDPVLAEVHDEADRRPDMEADKEGEPERLRSRLGGDDVVPPEKRREDHRVPEARHGEELGDALEDAEDDRLPVVHAAGVRVRDVSRRPPQPMPDDHARPRHRGAPLGSAPHRGRGPLRALFADVPAPVPSALPRLRFA